jgi:UrcA family protein
MKSTYRNTRIALLAGATLFSTGAWSLPPMTEPVVTRTMTLKYDPAEVATADGAALLYRKLLAAASDVCANPAYPSSRGFDDRYAHAACTSAALDKAVQQVDIPMLTTLHAPRVSVPDTAVAKR